MEKINVRVTKPRRRKNGRVVESPFYHLFWSVKGHGQGQHSLKVRELQVAEKLKNDFIREKERELSGIIAPRPVRDAASRSLTDHLAEFLGYMEGLNRSASHISHVGTRMRGLIADAGGVIFRMSPRSHLNSGGRRKRANCLSRRGMSIAPPCFRCWPGWKKTRNWPQTRSNA